MDHLAVAGINPYMGNARGLLGIEKQEIGRHEALGAAAGVVLLRGSAWNQKARLPIGVINQAAAIHALGGSLSTRHIRYVQQIFGKA